MKHEELFEENCAVARASAVLGERWVWPILRQAFNGAHRFEEFQRGIGLARNILSDRLNTLIDNDILERRSDPDGGARAHYRLTPKGHALFPVYVAMMEWGNHWTGLTAPPVDLLHKPCGHRMHARVVCSECGEEISDRDTEPAVGKGMFIHR
ncbi:winged helix-turn-helix transcriptional regulator [Williamsia sterculiae]|uniref:Transcriptional regulator, HxlR family n=1 Tax=Williamsia sterculiae TaxID=1344003 RepID=A0A1N7EQT6_9NOCA|nr:helix-turn-helix domain-containing protein [Williamsia sterculiae]SIR90447.1 transcriptional regulator, HxlR family [Williamsia sterculiae]